MSALIGVLATLGLLCFAAALYQPHDRHSDHLASAGVFAVYVALLVWLVYR